VPRPASRARYLRRRTTGASGIDRIAALYFRRIRPSAVAINGPIRAIQMSP